MGWKQLQNKLALPAKRVSRRNREGCFSALCSLNSNLPLEVSASSLWYISKLTQTLPFLNAQIYTWIKGFSALTFFTWRKVALLSPSFRVSHPAKPQSPIESLEGSWWSSIAGTVLVYGGGLAPAASGRFATVLLYTFEKQRPLLWPMTHVYPYPMAEVFSRLEYRNVCAATWGLFHCLTWRDPGIPHRWKQNPSLTAAFPLAAGAVGNCLVSIRFWFLFSFHFCRNHRATHTGHWARIHWLHCLSGYPSMSCANLLTIIHGVCPPSRGLHSLSKYLTGLQPDPLFTHPSTAHPCPQHTRV